MNNTSQSQLQTGMEIIVDPRVDYYDHFFEIKSFKLKLKCGNEDCNEYIEINQDWDDLITGGDCDKCDSILTFSPGLKLESFGSCTLK